MSLIRELATVLRTETEHPVGILSRAYLTGEKLLAMRERWEQTSTPQKARLLAEGLKRLTIRTGTRAR